MDSRGRRKFRSLAREAEEQEEQEQEDVGEGLESAGKDSGSGTSGLQRVVGTSGTQQRSRVGAAAAPPRRQGSGGRGRGKGQATARVQLSFAGVDGEEVEDEGNEGDGAGSLVGVPVSKSMRNTRALGSGRKGAVGARPRSLYGAERSGAAPAEIAQEAASGGGGEYSAARLAQLRSDTFRLSGGGSVQDAAAAAAAPVRIPTESEVAKAKAKRAERVRALLDAESFIPLSRRPVRPGIAEGEEAAGDADTSRLVRDEDDDMVIDPVDDRPVDAAVSFGAAAAGTAGGAAGALSELDTDPEILRWEQELIRKGTSTNLAMSRAEVADPLDVHAGMRGARGVAPGRPGSRTGGAELDGRTQLRTLSDSLQTLKDALKRHENERERARLELTATKHAVEGAEKETKEAATEYTFYAELRAWGTALVACHQAKLPRIEDLESRMDVARQARAVRAEAERRSRWRDLDPTAPELPGAAQTLPDAVVAQVPAVVYEASDRASRRARMARFLAHHRMRALRALEQRKLPSADIVEGDERDATPVSLQTDFTFLFGGLESDEEAAHSADSEGISAHADEKEAAAVLAEVDGVFLDVRDDIATLDSVLQQFLSWKASHPSDYEQSFAPLMVAPLLAPYARLSLLGWEPLSGGGLGSSESDPLGSLPWMDNLVTHDCAAACTLVSRICVPFVAEVLQSVYDPMNSKQTDAALSLVARLRLEVGRPEAHLEDAGADLEKKLGAALQICLVRAVVRVPVPRPDVVAAALASGSRSSSASLVYALLCDLLGAVLQLLENCAAWIAAEASLDQVLRDPVMDSLIGRRLVPLLRRLVPDPLVAFFLLRLVPLLQPRWLDLANSVRPLVAELGGRSSPALPSGLDPTEWARMCASLGVS